MHSDFSLVKQELKQLLGGNIQIAPLPSGAINRSFCVSQGDKGEQRYFLKLFDNVSAQKLDRPMLFAQQKYLATAGLAPSPVYLSRNRDFQLDQWIDATNLVQSDLSRIKKCQHLARTMSKIHQLEIPLTPLDLAYDWQYYLGHCAKTVSVAEQQQLSAMLDYWQQECRHSSVVCHNDLAFAHVTESPNTVVFDWEYSAFSNPFFDLASCITINQMSEPEQLSFMQAYAKERGMTTAYVAHKVCLMLPLVAKTNELWSLAFVGLA
ncbi:phosphotransferase [Paraglaciecola hydrolytica]|uniref:Aminoglycoside phosphotransferase domain-containing protein n=1 Tax=Paraglaciecola hydrolytica TaxID=1799789 RepID=A0A148KMT7_9ALTE|nr:phosphotransferase [Paraglaciecola hydrolytica]KXI27607.1 hypothetical protein AX660_18770 [Paraglaciecola hydrolytica]